MTVSLRVITSLLKKYLKPYVLQISLLTILLITTNVIEIFQPQIIRYYIDNISGSLEKLTIILSTVLYIGISLILRIFMIGVEYLSQNLGWATTNDLRADLAKHCMNLDMTFHNKYKPGEMIERIDGDASTLSEFFSTFTIYFFGSFILLLGIMIAVFVEGWIYGVIFLGFSILALIALYFVRKITAPLWKKTRESTTAMFGDIEESLSGMEDVRGNGANEFIMKKFHDIARVDFKNKNKAMIVSRIYYLINILMEAVLTIAILIASKYLYVPLGLSPGVVFLLLSYGTNILRPLRQILWQLQMLQNSLANIERIDEWFQIKTKIVDEGKTPFPTEKITLEFDNLNFGYNDDELILQNISFNLQPGKRLGLIGHTGSGKTTLARLIFRLYDTPNGGIKINGINSKEFPLKELRQNIAYVTQEVELFKASIKDNITFFDKSIPEEKIYQGLHDLGLYEWINNLPHGLESEVFSEECGLSAGEEQLLALNRAFLKNPKLVVLDEASSRLDPATERYIDSAIGKLLEGRSAIIIAHRLATLNDVDEILLLDKGRIIEYGSREDLVNDPNSHFSQLLQKGIEGVLH
ncbi:MAG: ABC transporter ATP-binding protein [Candidatus Thorarchaeota archaeon]